jgi:hypothetical protein
MNPTFPIKHLPRVKIGKLFEVKQHLPPLHYSIHTAVMISQAGISSDSINYNVLFKSNNVIWERSMLISIFTT